MLGKLLNFSAAGGKKKAKRQGALGIQMARDGFAVAYVTPGLDRPKINLLNYYAADSAAELAKQLAKLIGEFDLGSITTTLVLPKEKYQLLLLEQPDVADAELIEAIKWASQELLSFPVEESVLDYFKVPVARANDDAKLIYCAASRISEISEVMQQMHLAEINLQQISIPEISLKNVANLLPAGEQPQALFTFNKAGAKLLYLGNKELYMLRNININLDALFSTGGFEDPTMVIENLSLEVQRSVDYCMSYLGQPNINKIIFTPLLPEQHHIAAAIASSLNVEHEVIDINKLFESDASYDPALQANTLLALGGAIEE